MTSDTIPKHYYTIPEIARELEVAPSKIEFWRRNVGIIPQRKTAYGIKRFTARQLEKFKFVKEMSDSGNYTLKGIKEALELKDILNLNP